MRFSIEAGFFGPLARCITAALFGLILIGLSEFGSNIPKFGQIFRDDARIGHSIAGAGIAVLYATLYMASELYGLMGLTSAFIGVLAVTGLALFLSLRHGPPTAIMGLLGGFAAPYVAGLGAESMAPLLIYLAVFTAGLFGLAIYRGWAWLALLATGGSVLWTTALLFLDIGGEVPLLGSFIVLLAIGGVVATTRTGVSSALPSIALRAIPLVAGLIQLAVMAPLIEFSPLGWLFFGVLCVFTIILAWRDESMTPAVAGALGLMLVLIATAMWDFENDAGDILPAAAFTLLFTAAGHIFAEREKSGWMWALIGIAAPSAILPIMSLTGYLGWSNDFWGGLALAVAASNALMTWRTRNTTSAIVQVVSSALTAAFAATAFWIWLPDNYIALVAVAAAAALAFWARFNERIAISVQAVGAAIIAAGVMLFQNAGIVSALEKSLSGETNLYSSLPLVGPATIELLLPSLALAGLAYALRSGFARHIAIPIGAIGLTGAAAFGWLLFKQPLAIGPAEQFFAYGFAERAVLTHILALSGWLLLRGAPSLNWKQGANIAGFALGGLALFRFVYFDIALLSPTAVAQAMGPAPFANLGTIHYTAAAIWLWLYARSISFAQSKFPARRILEVGSLFAAIAAVMITVRQAVHGTNITTPPFTASETYLYSAALMALAIAWMMRGIKTTNALLRIAGLLLLTIVTFKVFLLDARQLEGILRILSFLGLGIALIGIGWIYGKVMRAGAAEEEVPA